MEAKMAAKNSILVYLGKYATVVIVFYIFDFYVFYYI